MKEIKSKVKSMEKVDLKLNLNHYLILIHTHKAIGVNLQH